MVPTFQEEKILENCLSVFTPELKKKYSFEVIVSDGGSSDRTVEIAKQYADTVIVHSGETKQGIAQGRNTGEEAAKGEILIFLNGDTIMQDPDGFLSYVSLWGSGKTDASSSPALACRVDVFPEEEIWKDRIFYTFHNQYVRMLNAIGLGMCRGECQIMKRSSFHAVGGYHAHLMSGEDFELYTRLARIGRIRYINSLVVLESPRRFRKLGYIRTLFIWTINSITVLFFDRSYSKEWKDVR
ncbi:MAG: glycosyltransferase [Bacteroidota bacterium]